jgi:hypothetical protein
MGLEDPAFADTVERLKAMALEGAAVPELLALAKIEIADRSSTAHALIALHRAFDVPIWIVTALGLWRGFGAQPAATHGDVLEADYGKMLRDSVRR